MVFVSMVLFTSVVLLLFVIAIDWYMRFKQPITIGDLRETLITVHLNVIYIYILVFFASLGTSSTPYILVILFLLMVNSQPFVWSLKMEGQIITISVLIRRRTLQMLLDEDCIITHFTFHKYAYALLKSEAIAFKEMIADSINDIKVVFFMYEPSWDSYSRIREAYEIQKKFFKYIKVDFAAMANPFDTDEKVLAAMEGAKKNRDPKIAFNYLRRLPWKFVYEEEPDFFFQHAVRHLAVVYNFFKTTLVAVFLMFVYFLYTIFFFKIQFLKQLSVWFVIGMLYFWLMSGFNFFVKRYQYGKFTSQIQRFWKRTNTSFWLIEGFLILLFFYYYLNSSQEPMYMYDYSALNQEFLVPLQIAGINVVVLSLVIYFMYFTLLRINSNSWTQLNLYLVLISVFIFFSFFIETYQFYYLLSTFNERLWVFNEDENMWGIDTDSPILRTKHQYLFVCLIAKYWHFLFIFLSWVFFLIKSFERRKVTYVLFGANLQNMILLYALNFACYLQWFKWIYRRFFDLPYTWFFANIDNKFFFRLFFEIKLLAMNLLTFNISIFKLNSVVYKSLNLWSVDALCMWKFL